MVLQGIPDGERVIALHRSETRNRARYCTVVCIAILLKTSSLLAQPSGIPLPAIEPFGLDGFQLMLQQQGMATTQTLATALRNPNETVLVFTGNISTAMQIRGSLTRFVEQGGALLVATDLADADSKSADWIFKSKFRYSKSSFPNKDRLQPTLSDCPLVTRLDHRAAPNLFNGVETIAANRPARLASTGSLVPIASLPTQLRQSRNEPLMAISRRDQERLLVIADHSIFINEMLIYADNAQFASNVAKWLSAGGKRKWLVVCHNNRLLSEWSFTGKPPSIPLKNLLKEVKKNGLSGLADLPIGDALLPVLNQSVVEFERQGGFNKLLHTFVRAKVRRKPLRIPYLIVTLILLSIALRWTLSTRNRPQRWLSFAGSGARNATRLTAAVHEKQFNPYLRTLAREFFAKAGVEHFANAKPPRIEVKTPMGAAAIRADVIRFWELATAATPSKMSQKTFTDLSARLKQLHLLQSQGRLELQ